jgi:archaellum component FlaC
MRTYSSQTGEHYQFICSVHDDIHDAAEQIRELAEMIVDIVGIAKDMGINMEDYLNRRKSTIEEMQEELGELKKDIKKLKTAAKRKAKKED